MKVIIILAAMIAVSTVGIGAQETAESQNKLGLEEFHKQNYEAAARLFEQAVTMKPDYASAYYNLGTAYFHLRSFEQSIEALRQSTKLEPASATNQNQLGVVYLEAGDPSRAVAEFREAIRRKPDYASAFYNVGCVHIRHEVRARAEPGANGAPWIRPRAGAGRTRRYVVKSSLPSPTI